MDKLRIALLQMESHNFDQTANLEKGGRFCREAKKQKADIALFPEMWNIGYTGFSPRKKGAKEEWMRQAIPTDSDYVKHFQKLARELEMAIAITYLQKWEGGPRNAVSLIDMQGEILFTYAKLHLCDFGVFERCCTPGEDFHVARLETAKGPVQIGAMICFDREFPESARILMLKGAEIILTPNACDLEINRLSQYRARAYENMVGLAMTNYPSPKANGHSIAYDGIAFRSDESHRDMLLVEAGEEEGLFIADFDLQALRAYRKREPWGDAYRKPHKYGLLLEDNPLPEFQREDLNGQAYSRKSR